MAIPRRFVPSRALLMFLLGFGPTVAMLATIRPG
jgi:hypothetical protein